MTENTNAIARRSEAVDAVESFTGKAVNVFSSFNTDDFEGRALVYKATSDAEPLNEHLGESLTITNFVAQAVTLTDEDGQEVDAVRTVLIGEDGTAYASVSNGIVRALQNLTGIMGMPAYWPDGKLTVKAVEERGRSGYRYMTLRLA